MATILAPFPVTDELDLEGSSAASTVVPRINLVAVATLPPAPDNPVAEGKSCTAGVVPLHAGGSVALPLPALGRYSRTLAEANYSVHSVEDIHPVRTPPYWTSADPPPPSRTPVGHNRIPPGRTPPAHTPPVWTSPASLHLRTIRCKTVIPFFVHHCYVPGVVSRDSLDGPRTSLGQPSIARPPSKVAWTPSVTGEPFRHMGYYLSPYTTNHTKSSIVNS